MSNQVIDATIFASSHPDIVKRVSVSSLIFSCIFLCVGILAFAATLGFEDKASTYSMGLLVLGTGACLTGIFRLFWKAKQNVYLPTGSVTKERSFFFNLKHVGELSHMVESGNFPVESDIKSEHSGNIRLDIILSEDKKFAAVQLFQFVPYTYQPLTAIRYLKNEEVSALTVFLQKSGMHA